MTQADIFRNDLIHVVSALRQLDPTLSRVNTHIMRRLIETALVELEEAVRLEYVTLQRATANREA